MIRVGVTGLTGMIGKNLLARHAGSQEAGREIELIAFTRPGSDTGELRRRRIECRQIDYSRRESFSLQLEDIDVLLHLAGLTKAVKPSEYYRANTQATSVLLAALSRYGSRVKQILFSSSTSASGPAASPREPKREDDPCTPVSHYGRSKLQAEQLIRSSGLSYTIVRLPAVWGPYDYDGLNLFRMARSGLITLFGRPQDPYSYLCAQDAGRFFLRMILDRRVYDNTYNLCYDRPLSGREFYLKVRRELGLTPGYRYLRVPRWASYPARAWLGLQQRISRRASIVNPDKIKELSALYWIYSNEKIKRALAVSSIEERGAFLETVRWFRDRKLL